MNEVPFIVPGIFGLAVVLMLFGWWRATNGQKTFLLIAGVFIVVESVLGLQGFYAVATKPPRFLLLTVPPLVVVFALFTFKGGKRFIGTLDLRTLTLLHSLRILVEGGLYALYLYKAAPQSMTFEGGNLDILSGLSAPVMYYFAFTGNGVRRKLLLGWNLVCMALLFNAVARGVASILGAQPGLAEPSRVVMPDFPYLLLPGFLVPLVLFAHLAAIRALLVRRVALA